MDMRLASRPDGDRLFIEMAGELDVASGPRLRDRVAAAVAEGFRDVVVDLRRCEFLDSAGMSALVGALRDVRRADGSLALLCPPGNSRRLIELAALDQVFPIHDDESTLPAPGGRF